MPYTCELIMLDRDTCGLPAEACPYCSRPHYFCPQCFPEHNKVHQPKPAEPQVPDVRPTLELKDARIKALEEENQKLKIQRRGFQIMARQMIACTTSSWMAKMDEGKYERAGGDVECRECRQTYYEHPQLPGLPTFHMICCGDIVKT